LGTERLVVVAPATLRGRVETVLLWVSALSSVVLALPAVAPVGTVPAVPTWVACLWASSALGLLADAVVTGLRGWGSLRAAAVVPTHRPLTR
jgi:hypothetical protein